MNLFIEYIQPLTLWLQENPNWALFIAFFISLTESLAIIGSIVPGSVTMTAIGILAGSGIMRIDLTLIASILGAVVGDSLSYFLGYFYSDQLNEIWPFKKYPSLIIYGKKFFEQHGGKSVLIGRFIGPLRSIIPIIAGITHMKQWRFLIANVLSAIGWSILYVVPGILIGAASHDLPAESATRLFILILLALVGIWILSRLFRWLIYRLSFFFKDYLHQVALKMKSNILFEMLLTIFAPCNEQNHAKTMALLIGASSTLGIFILISVLTAKTNLFSPYNLVVHYFIHTFRTSMLVSFFIASSQLINNYSIAAVYLAYCYWGISTKNYRILTYLTGIVLLASGLGVFLSQLIITPRPGGILVSMSGSSFPDTELLLATAFYGAILLFFKTNYSGLNTILKLIVLFILGINGLGALYLGDYWLSDVLCAYIGGCSVALFFFLFFRKNAASLDKSVLSIPIVALMGVFLFVTSSISYVIKSQELTNNHQEIKNAFILNESDWWDQQKPMLPLYRLNRLGNRISLINIQYEGTLESLQNSLLNNNWKIRSNSFFKNLLIKMNNQSDEVSLPLLTQLYENKSPTLIMTYKDKKSQAIFILRIWESNYQMDLTKKPLWVGSIDFSLSKSKHFYIPASESMSSFNALSYLLPALADFKVRRVSLPNQLVKPTHLPSIPYILLIKEHKKNH